MTEPFEIEDPLPCPALPGQVHVGEQVEDVVDALCADLLIHARGCVREFGDFHMALSGGSTPEPFYRRLMIDPKMRSFPWKKTHLWQVDERCVTDDDDRRNWKMIASILLDHSDIPLSQTHPMEVLAGDGDLRYEQSLREVLEWRQVGHDRLDFVLLGMGDDLHTASLFPHSPALDAPRERMVVFNDGPTVVPPKRMTMTAHFLNASRFVAVMVTGRKKQAALARLIADDLDMHDAPICAVAPAAGVQKWYVDRAACPDETS